MTVCLPGAAEKGKTTPLALCNNKTPRRTVQVTPCTPREVGPAAIYSALVFRGKALLFHSGELFPTAAVCSTWACGLLTFCLPWFPAIGVLFGSLQFPWHNLWVSLDAVLSFSLRVSTKCFYVLVTMWSPCLGFLDLKYGYWYFSSIFF